MWATLTLLAASTLSPAQATTGQLRFSNERTTYGVNGPVRTEADYLPGDVYCLTFDIENLKVDETGMILYSVGVELKDSKGDSKYKSDPAEMRLSQTLGGTRVPLGATVVIGSDTGPGEYKMEVKVTDRSTKQSQTLTKPFKVVAKKFGMVGVYCSYDPDGRITAPSMFVVGQPVHLNAFVGGFLRDKTSKQPKIVARITVLDDAGKPTTKPGTLEINRDVREDVSHVPVSAQLNLNRTGKFTVVLEATDELGRDAGSKVSFPITVLEAK